MPPESRSHMVSFRLTRAEHDRFRQLCSAHGLPSISEMARAAINMMFAEPGHTPPETVTRRLAELETRVDFLTAQLQKLMQQQTRESIQPQRLSAT